MNWIYITKIFAAFFVLSFGFFAFVKNRKSAVNQSFLLLTISIFIWLFFYAIAMRITNDYEKSLEFYKYGYIGIIFIPVAFYHFVSSFLGRRDTYLKAVIYLLALVFVVVLYSSSRLIDGLYLYKWGYYPQASHSIHPFFLFFFMGLFTLAFIFLFSEYLREVNLIRLAKLRYVISASVLASIGSIDFIPNYGITIYPFGFIFMIQLPLVFAYAIMKYRLMDISIVMTKTTIFLVVYSFVLGCPFAMGFILQEQLIHVLGNNWWIIPLISSTTLASIGPHIYGFIQKKAEQNLLQEQRQYQSTLRQASLGMGRIKNLNKLLTLIVHIVTRAVRLEHCSIYLLHEETGRFVLKAVKGKKFTETSLSAIPRDSILVSYLRKKMEPIVYDEIKQKAQDFNDKELFEIESISKTIDGALIVPSFIENKMIAIFVLGNKKSGKLYTQDDLAVFSILANQSALAIENAQFYENVKKTHEQLLQAEKMATIGTMADGLSHQINNRLHAMGFIAGDAIDSIKLHKPDQDTQKLLDEIKHSLERIQDNVKRGGEIVEGLLKYTRKGAEGFEAVDLNKLVDASIEMLQFKIKIDQINIVRNFNGNTPKILGNFTQLQEVFFNIIDNSYDAMMQRKDEMKEPGYKGCLEIGASRNGVKIEITFRDNGIGVKKENLEKLFTPFFTTKLSSRKGTGLGLYVIRQIIQENHEGGVSFTSEYKKGSETKMILPIFKENNNA